MIINFKVYAQYHIQTVKSFLHIRMNGKAKELDMKLNNSKIISNDILQGVQTSNFFNQHQKKQQDIKLFSDEFKKVNI